MEILPQLLAEIGLDARSEARIDGADPVLPTAFRIGDAAAAALAAGGLAAAELWSTRGNPPQRIRVDTVQATAGLLSFGLQRLDGAELPRLALSNPTVALYRARDGRYIHLHGGFPVLERGTLALLGVENDASEIAGAVAEWSAFELEEALAANGLCGAVVRSAGEWLAHPHGLLLARAPLIEVQRIGAAPALPLPPAPRPLGGLRVLDLTRVLAGPTCGRSLAAHGADVLRIGSPALPNIEPFVIDTGHGKRSAALDLTDPAQADTLRGLVRGADVFCDGYRPGALARRGFGRDQLAAYRPGLVQVEIDCYGQAGPWHDRPGWEQLAQCVSGIAAEQGSPGPPRLVPAAACDYITGQLAALGAMLALLHRAREGGSWLVRVSLTRTALWLLSIGRVDATGVRVDLAQMSRHLVASDTHWGRLLHLGPGVEMSATPAHWASPVVPLGTHAPRW